MLRRNRKDLLKVKEEPVSSVPDTSDLMSDHVIPSDPVRQSPSCEQSKSPNVQVPSPTVLTRNTGEEPVKTTRSG